MTNEDPCSAARTLLLVDDEPAILRTLARSLRGNGYRVLTASTPGEALQTLEQERIDVVVTDYRMPEMCGDRLMAAIRKNSPKTVGIMLSGQADLQQVVAAFNQELIHRYLAKPWDEEVLKAEIEAAFRLQAGQPELPPALGCGARAQSLSRELACAVARRQFFVVYQPKVSLSSGRVHSAEALLRWQHPQWGLISPVEFIPLAEQNGAILTIGDWLIDECCRQFARWRSEGLPLDSLAINLSPRQLEQPALLAHLLACVERHGMLPQQLVLEVTESESLTGCPEAIALLHALRSAGFELDLDDFGTGYSALGYLQGLPFSTLKIDRSLIDGLPGSATAEALVRHVLDLARALALDTIVEGVETEAQAQALRALGCDLVQGYLFSPPLEAAAFAAWVQRAQGAPAQATSGTTDTQASNGGLRS